MKRQTLLTPTVRELLTSNKEELRQTLKDLHPADIAEMMPDLKKDEQLQLFGLLEKDKAQQVFENLEEEEEAALLKHLEKEEVKQILTQMPPDEKADLFGKLPDNIVAKLFQLLSEEERLNLRKLLAYPEGSAGAIMTTEYVSFKPDLTASEAIKQIRKIAPRKETIYFTYITDDLGKLLGFVSLKDIVLARPDQRLKEVMHTNVISANLNQDQEEVAKTIHKYDLLAIPVVDNFNQLQGIVTVDDIMDVMEEENTEDIYKMASIERLDEKYFDASFSTLARKRIIWLTILLFTYTFSTSLLRHYSPTLEFVVALAYFIPMLTGSGGNAGTQTATLIIRGLAVGEIKFKQIFKVLKREIGMGLILGTFLGGLGYIRALTMEKNPTFSLIIGIALICTITTATLTGALLPLLLRKLKLDPAIAAGPFLTTIVDLTALIIYFEIAKLLLSL